MSDSPAQEFDWVTARNGCSAATVFQRLKAMAKANVDTRNGQRPGSAEFKDGESTFAVRSAHGGTSNAADFSLSAHVITIQRHEHLRRHDHTFEVTVSLNNEGVCKCHLDGEELDLWQALKKVLEPVLFD